MLLREFVTSVKSHSTLADKILSDSIGYGVLSVFVSDENLEEIMVNGYDRNVFVFHKRYGVCKTNISYTDNCSNT